MLHLPELQPVWCLPGCFKRNEEEKFADRVVIFIRQNGLHQPSEKGTICSIRTCIKYGKIQKEVSKMDRMKQQIAFLMEIDKVKNIFRTDVSCRWKEKGE